MHSAREFITALLLSKGLPFAIWRMPETEKVYYLIQKEKRVAGLPFEKLETEKGFVIAPYQSWKTGTLFLLQPGIFFEEHRFPEVREEIEALPPGSVRFSTPNSPMSKNSYLQKAVFLTEKLKKQEVQKAVLTRYLYFPYEKSFSFIPAFYNALTQQYTNAFTYLFYLPGAGIWTGATPEVLLTQKGNRYETVSLAGTRLYREPVQWSKKELEEQDFVTRYIEQRLLSLGINQFEKSPVKTVKAGNLAHLKTTFEIDEKDLNGKRGELVRLLHPTPAVGGLPKEKTLTLLEETEQYDRRFYTGFLGPWNTGRQMQSLFVNLRCAEWHHDALGIYVGGGLTAASLPENEWLETVNKSETLLAVAKKIRPLRHDIG